MFLTSLMSMRRTERRSFWPDFIADFISSWRRANNDIDAPARLWRGFRPLGCCCKNAPGLLLRGGRVSYRVSRRTSRHTLEGGATGQSNTRGIGFVPRETNVKPPKQSQ